jgi:hypothetical protein
MSRSRANLSVVAPDVPDAPPESTTEESGWPTGWEFPTTRDDGCDDWCKPLHLVEQAIKGKPWAKHFDVDDFMIMSRFTDSHGTLTHYKHYITRHYINVDTTGTTYTYNDRNCDRADKRHGYSNTQRLRTAVEALGLWELPWMTSGLEADRLGLAYEDRWQHPMAPKSTRLTTKLSDMIAKR